MKFILLIFVFCFSIKLFAALPAQCPEGIGVREGSTPPIALVPSHDFILMVCGHKFSSDSPDTVITEFNVYSIDKGNQVSKPLFEASASDDYRLTKEHGKLVLTQLEKVNDQFQPLLETSIECNQTCAVSNPKCVFKPLKSNDEDAVAKFSRYIDGSIKRKNAKPDLIQKAYASALSGNKKALNLFLNADPSISFHDDSNDIYENAKVHLRRLRKTGCL